MFVEPKQKGAPALPDASAREKWILIPIVVLVFWIGVWPGFFLSRMHASVDAVLRPVVEAEVARESVSSGAADAADPEITPNVGE
jgi:NADH-quinone oxidoreductase subunit M